MAEYRAPRGTRDVLPSETPAWQYIEDCFRRTCALSNYWELRTPTFEETELFARNLGETTDVVSKEMYTFESRSGKSLTLRPEGTAPAIRAYVQHNLAASSSVNKIYYIGRIFRYERPQAGRYREHTQLGVEAIGSLDPALDAEVISLASSFFRGLGIVEFDLRLNSIGCPNCRPAHREALVEYARESMASLCPTCVQRYEQNPLRMLDCKEEDCRRALAEAPRTVDFLCTECAGHFERVQQHLQDLGIDYRVDSTLVRGFDYYTKTAFEFASSQLGAQNAIGGGGRYDNLVEEIGGPPTPAVGFGLGLDRLVLTLEALGVAVPAERGVRVFVAGLGDAGHAEAAKLISSLRAEGISADMDYTGRSLKAQMKMANRSSARYALLLGDEEIANGTVTLRDMQSSEQVTVPMPELIERVRR